MKSIWKPFVKDSEQYNQAPVVKRNEKFLTVINLYNYPQYYSEDIAPVLFYLKINKSSSQSI